MESRENINETRLKLFPVFTGIFCALLIIVNVNNAKVLPFIGSLTIIGGTLLFPITFIFNDILTEVYGYRLARKVVWTGFLCQVIAIFSIWLVSVLPAADFWHNQEAYNVILGAVPRIILASLTAFFCGEFVNSFVLSKMKYWVRGRRGASQAWRFIASTVVGEALDSIVFITVAFAGVLPLSGLISTTLGIYIFKVTYEVVATPFSTRFADWVKKVEGVDRIDTPETTSYNPFLIFK